MNEWSEKDEWGYIDEEDVRWMWWNFFFWMDLVGVFVYVYKMI